MTNPPSLFDKPLPFRLLPSVLLLGSMFAMNHAFAAPQFSSTARTMAMGGTGVASANPAAATVRNPALMASRQHEWANDFAFNISAGARAVNHEEIQSQAEGIDDSLSAFEELAADVDQALQSGATAEQVESLRTRARQQTTIIRDQLIDVDEQVVRLDAGGDASIVLPREDFAVGFFAGARLRATAKGDLSDDDLTLMNEIALSETPEEFANGDNPKQIDDLNSKAELLASGYSELGLAIATSIDLDRYHSLQVGISPKIVQLHTYQYTELIEDFDEDDLSNEQYHTSTNGLNVDVGINYQFGREQQWNVALVAKNLIPMSLESAQSRPLIEPLFTYELKPMVSAGLAYRSNWYMLTADIDLTIREAFSYTDNTQWAAIGAELDIAHYAQIRFGTRHNLASEVDNDTKEGTQLTAGFGLSPYGLHFDIAGLVDLQSEEVGAVAEIGVAF